MGTTAVAAEAAVARPPVLRAISTTRSVWPTSARDTAYFEAVAPRIAAHLAPAALQRFHCSVMVGTPVQRPRPAVRVEPTAALPLTIGTARFCGTATPKATSPRLLPRRHRRSPAAAPEGIVAEGVITAPSAHPVPRAGGGRPNQARPHTQKCGGG